MSPLHGLASEPKIIRDLKLHRHGLRILEGPFELPAPPDGHHLIVALGGTQGEIAKFSDRDATGLTPTRRGSSA